ncbi:hypothetical protein J8F10_13375 [Gemmata sp. G18]|uniref:Lipoprotein n=1 Tax=Gemmata palustris TaxID=2822762 RepID=A0ABS5BRC2_9BACT|nr:hypothetical protein [Gemmata palustris]MBP3956275.1 hypothetical protein [Gemmata palustris]
MTRFLIAVAAAVVGVGTACGGGPPPMYVVADKVTVEADRVTIHGTFIRLKEGKGNEYGAPVEGVVCLGLSEMQGDDCRAEWTQWAKAAGTGRAISVGMCGAGGTLLTVKIHGPGAQPKAADAEYAPGHLGKVTSKQEWAEEPPVKALLAFVKEKKSARTTQK